jgi:hypothetical protein
MDVLAQRYENKSSTITTMGKIARYNYTDTEIQTLIASIFKAQYGTVAQANFILQNIDESAGILDETTRKIIKGEVLAMRAYVHFDLARLFSERYDNGANAGKSSVAYLKSFTVVPQTRLTLGEVLSQCEADLKEAEKKDRSDISSRDLFRRIRQNKR